MNARGARRLWRGVVSAVVAALLVFGGESSEVRAQQPQQGEAQSVAPKPAQPDPSIAEPTPSPPAPAPPTPPQAARSTGPSEAFLKALDLSPLDRAAVHHQGRLKSFRMFAHEWIGYISGSRSVLGLQDDVALLDLLFNPGRYTDVDMIYIKPKDMRDRLAEEFATLTGPDAVPPERLEAFRRSGLTSERLLSTPGASALLERWSMDLIRTAKFVDQARNAIGARQPQNISEQLKVIPPPGGDEKTPWLATDELFAGGLLTLGKEEHPILRPDPMLVTELRNQWLKLVPAWRSEDAAAANEAIAEFARVLPQMNPAVYPEGTRLEWETWYFDNGNLTWVWLIYLGSIVFLLMSVVYRWGAARALGLAMFLAGFGLHTFAIGLRWYVSGRWPNSNMFEAVTTSVWFGACVALVLEWVVRRTPMRNVFALTAAAGSMCAMMAARFVPQLNPSINNMMPILHDLWLYIHTNVIIASYALIFMASVTAVLYCAWRLIGGGPAYARAGGTGALIESLDAAEGPSPAAGLTPGMPARRGSPGEVLDGATMVLMELSFVLLWAGLVMGAIWADHSWGRPWGWDPKEVFALCTFLIFLILVHVRLKVRDKGLWTALLAIAGCGVMLFNWIVINFVITGLHSYA